jgi:hypothetical protein
MIVGSPKAHPRSRASSRKEARLLVVVPHIVARLDYGSSIAAESGAFDSLAYFSWPFDVIR